MANFKKAFDLMIVHKGKEKRLFLRTLRRESRLKKETEKEEQQQKDY